MRARASVVTVLAATLLVVGCSGGDEPEAEPTPILPSSSSAEPSPSESEAAEETAPEMPRSASRDSFDGAEAFIRHWADSITFAINTGDTEALEALYADGCQSCEGTTSEIDRIWGEGGRMRSDGWRTKQVGFVQGQGPENVGASFARGREVVTVPGEERQVFPASDTALSFELERSGGQWVINEFTAVE